MNSATSKNPLFSIITPTFRRPEMLARNIRSVLMQSFGNFEQIIVDEANDPVTDKIVGSFDDDRLVLLKHDRPKGAAAAYNTGMKAARGEFIAFLDDDDEYMPVFLERMNERFLASGKNFGFIWTGIERVRDDEFGEHIFARLIWPPSFSNIEKGLVAATSIGNGYGVCLRRACIETIGLYDESLSVAEDTDFLIRLSQKYDFQTIPEILVRLHRHGAKQLTRSENFLERIEGKEKILKRYKFFLEKFPGLYTEHYRGYAGLCYRAGYKEKGRKAFHTIFKKMPFRLILYIDFLTLETSGKFFTELNFIKSVRTLRPSR